MKEHSVEVALQYELENLHHVVVQASNVMENNITALQLLNGQTDVVVFQTSAKDTNAFFFEDYPVLYLDGVKQDGKAGGHTQTWIDAGRKDYYFVGVKPKKYGSHYWDTQIARVKVEPNIHNRFHNNTEMTRLSFLNRAGYGYRNNEVVYPGKNLVRLEAAVSPDKHRFLIASIDKDHNGHFALYDLNEINAKLDQSGTNDLNIQDVHCLEAFIIPNFNSEILHSVQGYALDNDDNIYVSSQPGPHANLFGFAKQGKPRLIVKIPWGIIDPNKWDVANLNQKKEFNLFGYVTEFEGIQVVNANLLYLTVAYHSIGDLKTHKNRIYRIEGFGK